MLCAIRKKERTAVFSVVRDSKKERTAVFSVVRDSKKECSMRAIALTLFAAVAFAAKPGLNTQTIWDLRSVADPQITKDGKSIIYVLGFNDKMTDQKLSNLWMISSDGKDNRPLTTGAYRDSSPRISPDGTRIAYLSNRSGK